MKKHILHIILFFVLQQLGAQTLNLPPRSSAALTGSQFVTSISSSTMSLATRENLIYTEISTGNVPNFYRNLVPVTSSATINGVVNKVTYYVIPDYLAVGSDANYFLCPMSPMLAKRIGDLTGCTLPTRKMVNDIWTAASVHLAPSPISSSSSMSSVPVFNQHNTTVKGQRQAVIASKPLGSLVSGDKKDVVISNKIYTSANRVVIYGWHYQNGIAIQPMTNVHGDTYMDYSHGIRLVQNSCKLNGTTSATIQSILQSSTLYPILSDEGKISLPYFPYYTACAYTLSPNSQSFTSSSGTGSFSLTAPSNCAWTATTSNSWISFPNVNSGNGSFVFQYNISANSSTVARTGTITISGKTHIVYQSGTGISASPANDLCSNAQIIQSSTSVFSISGNSNNATQSNSAISCGSYTGNADDDVWYKFTAIKTKHTVNVKGDTGFDAVIDVKSGSCSSFTNVACADAASNAGYESANLTGLTVGSTYYIRIYNYRVGGGTFSISVTHSPYALKEGETEDENTISESKESEGGAFTVYPNPSNGTFNIYSRSLPSEGTIEVFVQDIMGKTIYSKKISAENRDVEKNITLENASKGMYFVKIISGNSTNVQKLIIE